MSTQTDNLKLNLFAVGDKIDLIGIYNQAITALDAAAKALQDTTAHHTQQISALQTTVQEHTQHLDALGTLDPVSILDVETIAKATVTAKGIVTSNEMGEV